MFATYGWEKLLKDTEAAALDSDVDDDDHDGSGSNNEDDVALGGEVDPRDVTDRLIAHFKVPLKQSNAVTDDILEEFKDVCS